MLSRIVSATLLLVAAGSMADAMPLAPLPTSAAVEQASFWAQPYPYGYRWRKTACVRYVPSCAQAVVPSCEVRWRRAVVCR